MNNFEAVLQNSKQISIVSDTTWEAYVIGNFQISSYYGKGNNTIDVLLPDDINEANGTVYFKYGDEKCLYPSIDIRYTNPCYIETIPKAKKCKDTKENEKVVFLFFKEDKELMELLISSKVQNWSIEQTSGYQYFLDVNKIIIISNNKEGTFIINVNNCSKIIVKILRNPNQ